MSSLGPGSYVPTSIRGAYAASRIPATLKDWTDRPYGEGPSVAAARQKLAQAIVTYERAGRGHREQQRSVSRLIPMILSCPIEVGAQRIP